MQIKIVGFATGFAYAFSLLWMSLPVARAQECRVLNIPKLDPKPAANRTWPGDRHWENRARAGVAWFGRFDRHSNYAEVRVAYDADGLDVHFNVPDLFLWQILTDGPQWGGKLVGAHEKWDAIELSIEPEATSGLSSKALRVLLAHYPQYDPKKTSSPNIATKTWVGANTGWQPVADPTAAGRFWYHWLNASWNGTGPNDNTRSRGGQSYDTEFDNGAEYQVFIPWASLGLDKEPASGATLRMMARVYDVDDPKDTDATNLKPSSAGSEQKGPLTPTVWPESAKDADPASWATVILNQAPYVPPSVTSEQTITLNPGDVPMRDVTVGGHAFIKDRWIAGGGTDATYAWESCMDTKFSAASNAIDLLVHPEGGPTHLCFFSRALIFYDISNRIPKGQIVTRAELRLFHDGGDSQQDSGDLFVVRDSPTQVHRLERAWTDAPLADTVTWNTAPLAAENAGFGLVAKENMPGRYVSFDLTPIAARAVLRGEPLNLALYGADTTANTGKYFVASEDGSNKPQLVISFGPAADPSKVPSAETCSLGVAKGQFPTDGTGTLSAPVLPNGTPSSQDATTPQNGNAGAGSVGGCTVVAAAPSMPNLSGFLLTLLVVLRARRKMR